MNQLLKEKLIQIAQEEANKAIKNNCSPFGALLVNSDGEIFERAYNTSNLENDPTAHAEINLIRKACKKLNSKDLSKFYLVSNAQSCSMCISAAIKAKISNFIYGAPSEGHMNPAINVFDIADKCNSQINIESGILAIECKKQIEDARKKMSR